MVLISKTSALHWKRIRRKRVEIYFTGPQWYNTESMPKATNILWLSKYKLIINRTEVMNKIVINKWYYYSLTASWAPAQIKFLEINAKLALI